MADILDDDFEPSPPSAERVAARVLVLAAISCRALIEKDAVKKGAEELRKSILPWLQTVGVSEEMEPMEAEMIGTPLGKLDAKAGLNASWQSEAMVALGWALGWAEMPPAWRQCEPSDVANSLGFLAKRENTPLLNSKFRDEKDIEDQRNTCLTLHWRLRQFSIDSKPIDFPAYVARCQWAEMRLGDLEIVGDDLAIDGVRIDNVKHERWREVLSITQERHQALNWLLGFEPLYSQVTTDT